MVKRSFKPVQNAAKAVLKKCPYGSHGLESLRRRNLSAACRKALMQLRKAERAYYGYR